MIGFLDEKGPIPNIMFMFNVFIIYDFFLIGLRDEKGPSAKAAAGAGASLGAMIGK